MLDRRLQVFHAVAKHRSFTKAADALCTTQPAVTFQIHQLEDHFNTRLFDRASGGIALTPAGIIAVEYVQQILALYAELDARVKDLSEQAVGPLTIGASTTVAEFLLPRVLGEFKVHHPGVVPHLIVANSVTVQARVAERTLDLGFIESDSHIPTLITDVCCEDELQVVCAPSHRLARCRELALDTLTQHGYISRESGSGTREVIDHYLKKAGLPPDSLQVIMEATSPEALKGLVATGVGFAIVSRAAADKEVRLGDLVRIPLAPPLIRHLSVVYPKERMHPKVVTEFISFAKERLAASGTTEDRAAAAEH
ncbi:MAG: LysR family transcriptional regulator [Betaproteobacteria bacterium]|nr:LysR family transcriptional regulator [Betaproteobacteria bacterium]MDE2004438.1 LysR family transcriptional regulator [Betaproteobacteria bacterium]